MAADGAHEQKPGSWQRVKTGLAKVWTAAFALGAIGWLGAGVVVAGVLIAWRSDNASPVLITGALLIGVSVVASYFEELTVSYKDLEATVRRGAVLRDVESKVERIESSSELPPELRDDVDQIKQALRTVQNELATSRAPKVGGRFWPPSRATSARGSIVRSGSYSASSTKNKDGSVILSLVRPLITTSTATRCTVTAPDGLRYQTSDVALLGGFSSGTVLFPQQFLGASDAILGEGTYYYVWEEEDPATGIPLVVASGTFTLP